jgi:hypothetical protein
VGRVLARFRATGKQVAPAARLGCLYASFMRPGSDGVEIHDAVAPAAASRS